MSENTAATSIVEGSASLTDNKISNSISIYTASIRQVRQDKCERKDYLALRKEAMSGVVGFAEIIWPETKRFVADWVLLLEKYTAMTLDELKTDYHDLREQNGTFQKRIDILIKKYERAIAGNEEFMETRTEATREDMTTEMLKNRVAARREKIKALGMQGVTVVSCLSVVAAGGAYFSYKSSKRASEASDLAKCEADKLQEVIKMVDSVEKMNARLGSMLMSCAQSLNDLDQELKRFDFNLKIANQVQSENRANRCLEAINSRAKECVQDGQDFLKAIVPYEVAIMKVSMNEPVNVRDRIAYRERMKMLK